MDINGRLNLPLSLNGYIATRDNSGTIIVAFRGTSDWVNWITDFTQYLVGISLVYFMALGLLVEIQKQYKECNLMVVGHSLGGGLMQFAVGGLNNSKVNGFGFNSAGLSDLAFNLLKGRNDGNICHLHLKYDQVFLIGHQLGNCFEMPDPVLNPYKAHKLLMLRKDLGINNDIPYYYMP